jgi:hypothetical protein
VERRRLGRLSVGNGPMEARREGKETEAIWFYIEFVRITTPSTKLLKFEVMEPSSCG